ncbi:MAG: histidine phosphatase family protein [Pseudomonadota bacterium]
MKHHPELYILRHGQTQWNAEHRIQGTLDSPLTSKGQAHARAQHQILCTRNLQDFRAICSPQGRAMQTAEIALKGLITPVIEDPRLAEIGVGSWEGLRRDELLLTHPPDESEEGALSLYERAPGGEGFAALKVRCQAFLDDLQAPAVVVTHGITSRMLRVILLGLDIVDLGRLQGGQGNVFHLKDGVQTVLE